MVFVCVNLNFGFYGIGDACQLWPPSKVNHTACCETSAGTATPCVALVIPT